MFDENSMNIFLKLMIGLFLASVVLVGILGLYLFLYKNGYIEHSAFYDHLDKNSDDRLSYSEWMAYYSLPAHNHPIESCMRSDFYRADCDQDDILTWREYYNFRFRGKRCNSALESTIDQGTRSNYKPNTTTPLDALSISGSQSEAESLKNDEKYISALKAIETELKEKYGI